MARLLTGVVTSDKANKTIVITVVSRKTHPVYKKQYSSHSKFMAHDEKNEAKISDLVMVKEHRPLSAKKRFILAKIVQKAGAGFEEKDATADIPEEELVKKPLPPKPKKAAKAPKAEKTASKKART